MFLTKTFSARLPAISNPKLPDECGKLGRMFSSVQPKQLAWIESGGFRIWITEICFLLCTAYLKTLHCRT